MEDSRSIIQVRELVDIALGYPEFGVVNFNLLHGLLHVMTNELFNSNDNLIHIIQSADGKYETILHKIHKKSSNSNLHHYDDEKFNDNKNIEHDEKNVSSKDISRKRGGLNLQKMNSVNHQLKQNSLTSNDTNKLKNKNDDNMKNLNAIYGNNLDDMETHELWNKNNKSKSNISKKSENIIDMQDNIVKFPPKNEQKISPKYNELDTCDKNDNDSDDDEVHILHRRNSNKISDEEKDIIRKHSKEISSKVNLKFMEQIKEKDLIKTNNDEMNYMHKENKETDNTDQLLRGKNDIDKNNDVVNNDEQVNWSNMKVNDKELYRSETDYWNKMCTEESNVLRQQAAECWSKINDLEAALLRTQCKEYFSDDSSDILHKRSTFNICNDNDREVLRKQAQECFSKIKKNNLSINSKEIQNQFNEIRNNINDKVNNVIKNESVLDELIVDNNTELENNDRDLDNFLLAELNKISKKVSPTKTSIDDDENNEKSSNQNIFNNNIQDNNYHKTNQLFTLSNININSNNLNIDNNIEHERAGTDYYLNDQIVQRHRGGMDENLDLKLVDRSKSNIDDSAPSGSHSHINVFDNKIDKMQYDLAILKYQQNRFKKQLDTGNKSIIYLQDLIKCQLATNEFKTLIKTEHLDFVIKEIKESEKKSKHLKNDVQSLMENVKTNVIAIMDFMSKMLECNNVTTDTNIRRPNDLTSIDNEISLIYGKLNHIENEFCDMKTNSAYPEKKLIDYETNNQQSSSLTSPHVVDLHNELTSIRDFINNIEKKYTSITKDNENLIENFNIFLADFNNFKKTRMENEEIYDLLAEKVDYEMLDRKISYNSFEKNNRSLEYHVDETLERIRKVETRFSNEIHNLWDKLNNKLDQNQIDLLETKLNTKLDELNKKIDSLIPLNNKPIDTLSSATRTATRILNNVNCIACDRDVVMRANELGQLPKLDRAHCMKITKPDLLYSETVKRNKFYPNNLCEGNLKRSESNQLICEPPKIDLNKVVKRRCGGSHTKITNEDRIEKGIGNSPIAKAKNPNREVDTKLTVCSGNKQK